MDKGRLVAFTDAIIAIAATIMVLELKVPDISGVGDWGSLAPAAATFVAYIASFMMIAAAWYAHHNLFVDAERVTSEAFFPNMLWVLIITLIPFVTAWVGSAYTIVLPSLLYLLIQLLSLLTFLLLGRQMVKDNPGMKTPVVKPAALIVPCVMFVAGMALVPLYPPISLWVTVVTAVWAHAYIAFSKKATSK